VNGWTRFPRHPASPTAPAALSRKSPLLGRADFVISRDFERLDHRRVIPFGASMRGAAVEELLGAGSIGNDTPSARAFESARLRSF
jgi:hypothetical protein